MATSFAGLRANCMQLTRSFTFSFSHSSYNVGVDTILLCFCQDCMMHENAGTSDTKLFNKGMQNRIKAITEADKATSQKYAKETELTETLNK